MAVNDLERKVAEAIVEIFENGKINLSSYGTVTLLKGDTGGLTFGRHQTTLNSGNLYLLVKRYVEAPDAMYGKNLEVYLNRLARRDQSLNNDMAFRATLKATGSCRAMVREQDEFFEQVYWTPSARTAAGMGFVLPLSYAVVYDSFIHGSWQRILKRVQADTNDEKSWIRAYVRARRHWLATHSNALLHKCVYRMDAFQHLIDSGAWALELPLLVRGIRITPEKIGMDAAPIEAVPEPAVRVSGEGKTRLLLLTDPFMSGDDVAELQRALNAKGFQISVDGRFGRGTQAAIVDFQRLSGLKPDGIVGPATKSALGVNEPDVD